MVQQLFPGSEKLRAQPTPERLSLAVSPHVDDETRVLLEFAGAVLALEALPLGVPPHVHHQAPHLGKSPGTLAALVGLVRVPPQVPLVKQTGQASPAQSRLPVGVEPRVVVHPGSVLDESRTHPALKLSDSRGVLGRRNFCAGRFRERMVPEVGGQGRLEHKGAGTVGTLVRLLARVAVCVHDQLRLDAEAHGAQAALEWLLAGVGSHVPHQRDLLGKEHGAEPALVRHVARVDTDVGHQAVLGRERRQAVVALKRFSGEVVPLVDHQGTPGPEGSRADAALVRPVGCVGLNVCHEFVHAGERSAALPALERPSARLERLERHDSGACCLPRLLCG